MEELQTDTLSDYGKNPHQENTDLDSCRDNENGCAASLLNGCEEVDPLDLMDHCDNVSIASNSDVWKGSDSEDESFEKKENSTENVESNKENDKTIGDIGVEVTDKQIDFEEEIDKAVTNQLNVTKDGNSEELPNATGVQNDDNSGEQCINDVNKKSSADDNNKIDEENVGDSSVIESEEPIETKKPDNKEEEEKKNEIEKPADETTDSLKENQDPVNTSGEVLANDEAEKTSADDKTSSKEAEVAVMDDKDPLADDELKDSTDARFPARNNENQDEDCQMEYDAEDDDDFDPSLLCPEVSMAVDDDPLITTNGPVPDDTGPESPLPYEPVFSTFVDEVTGAEISFNLTNEEQELRKRMYGPTNPVHLTKIHCTACNVHLGSALEGQNNRFVHPLLKVLICKECYHFYTSGEFERDEDGSELYCRWCGQGGQVLCCSKCEFVFCKRCIRTNFGRKKMFEIRDSDSWDCFRCNQSQIMTQRIACYEFFEYIRREMSRAATLNSPEIWSRDHSRCCLAKKRAAEDGEEVKKPKKRKNVDPDYNPLKDKIESNNSPSLVVNPSAALGSAMPITAAKGITIPKPIQIVPRYTLNKKDNDIEFVRQIPAPRVTITSTPRPTYRTILPSHVRPVMQSSPTLVRISSQPVPALVPTTGRILGSALQNRNSNTPSMMKHEWFEKTVRAAARVNSHLSYTLTQLNKAQSQAASVEELAVVHNKLQEILSSSINSLIQIRKNLRTEFIAGIKTVRLPSKKVDTSDTANNDDDVIFVSAPTTLSMPSTSQARTPINDPLIIIDKSSPIVSSKRTSAASTERPKGGYLKVKSVMELQNVPSECITIPDDPLPPEAIEAEKEASVSKDAVCNGASKGEQVNKDSEKVDNKGYEKEESKDSEKKVNKSSQKRDKDKKSEEDKKEIPPTETIDLSDVPNSNENSFNKETEISEPSESDTSQSKGGKMKTRASKDNNIMHNLTSEPSVEIKRMMSVKVHLQRDNLEELQKTLATK